MQILNILDFKCVALVATHCDNNKLCISENEAIESDLANLFCNDWYEIELTINEVINYINALAEYNLNPIGEPPIQPDNYEQKKTLLYGGSYISICGKKTIIFKGIIRILVYYTYARYVILNSFNDTAVGLVSKNGDFSSQIDPKKLEAFSNKYRNMAFDMFKNTEGYLAANNDAFEWYEPKNKGCGCGHSKCTSGTKNKGFGFKSAIITK